MSKKNFLAFFALVVLTCSSVNAQMFTAFTPADLNNFGGLNLMAGDTFSGSVNIGSFFQLNPTDVTLTIGNGNVANNGTSWTVGENNSTTFSLGGPVAVDAFVNHGANLGSPSFAGASGISATASDGVTAAPGESFTLQSALDSNFAVSQSGNSTLVSFVGLDDGTIATNTPGGNQTGFFFTSDQPVSQYTVFSTNTSSADLNDNFTTGFRIAATAIPEPSSAALVALSGLFFLRRKRS